MKCLSCGREPERYGEHLSPKVPMAVLEAQTKRLRENDFAGMETMRTFALNIIDDLVDITRAAMPQGEPVAWHEPTPAQIASACMSYRHDFGLLDATAQQTMKWQAGEWFRAWQKEFEASPSLPVSEPGGWQPIETAPKDGSKVDLLYPYPRGRTNDCKWLEGGVYGDGGWYWLTPKWGSQPGLGVDWHLLPETEWDLNSYPNDEPTHWMLPPPAPEAQP